MNTLKVQYKRKMTRYWIYHLAKTGTMRDFIQIGSISIDEPKAEVDAHAKYCLKWFKDKYVPQPRD